MKKKTKRRTTAPERAEDFSLQTSHFSIPRLRFPEFRDEPGWEKKQLASIFKRITNGNANAQDHDENGQYPLFDRSEIIKRSDKFFFDAEAVIIPGEGMRFQPRYFKGKFNLHQRAYALLDCEENSYYTFYALDRSKELLARKAVQSTVLSLRMPIIEKLAIAVPTPAEQQKIADCLSSLDGLMAAEGRKLEALKAHKKGLMQQLFPQPGQTQPRLRFPEFRGKGEWEEKEVGEVFRVTRGEVLAMPLVKDERTEDAPYPVYSSQTKNVGLAGYYLEYLYEDAITWTTDGANAGDVNYRPGKFFCTNVCGVLISDKGFANPCTAALINSVSRQHVSYVGNPKLMNGVMAKIRVAFPPPAEQQVIADCLTALDTRIAAQAAKIETLKQHKRGLMQQLFPSPEEQ